MNKNKRFKLKIENPCAAKWENMGQDENGRFCSSCKKNVIDFTTKTKREIALALANSDTKMCGRFTDKQLEESYSLIDSPKMQANWYQSAAASLLVMLGAKEATAQSEASMEPQTRTESNILIGDTIILETPPSKTQQQLMETFVIEGKMIDSETREPILFHKIYTSDNKRGAISDMDGYFKLSIPASSFTDTLELIVEGIEYARKTIVLSRSQLKASESNFLEVILEMDVQLIEGIIVIDKPEKVRKKNRRK